MGNLAGMPDGAGRGRVRVLGLIPPVLLAAAFASPVPAGNPEFILEGSLEIEDEYVFDADDPEVELNDLGATLDLDAAIVWPNVGLYVTTVFEPVLDAEGDRAFGDMGLYVEELYLQFEPGPTELRMGKLAPLFGLIEDREPGLYGDELAGDYELSERIGLEATLPFEALGGEHELALSTFAADRTPLSGSLVTSRERLRLSDGGVSNTDYLGSFAITSTGEIGSTEYTAGVRFQNAGHEDESDEYGGVLGVAHQTGLLGQELVLLAEAAHFPRYDGDKDGATFLTLGTETEIGPAWLTLYAGLRDQPGEPTARLGTVAVEAPLEEAFSVAAGYLFFEEENETTHTLGLRLTYEFGLP